MTSDTVAVVFLGEGPLTVAEVTAVARDAATVEFAAGVAERLRASRDIVEAHLGSGVGVYGLNRELGADRNIAVADDAIAAFQRRVIRNHNAALGEPLPRDQVRALILGRLSGFTRGGSGVRPELAEFYRQLLNRGVEPLVRRTGSVGAADLVQLAAVAAVVLGEGSASVDGVVTTGAAALAAAGLEPLPLEAQEGLATMSSNAYTAGVGALLLGDTAAVPPLADSIVALSLQALRLHGAGGNPSPFDPAVAIARGSREQALSAERILAGLAGTAVLAPAADGVAISTQDHVSFRSAPQLHGSLAASVAAAIRQAENELVARNDNPLVDIDSGRLISGGNFQSADLALSLESLRVALASAAGASERRLAALSRLQGPHRRAGTARVPGLLWYSASAQLAEVRHLANPVTLLGTSLSDEVEDHSAHGPLALQQLERMLPLVRSILTVEALTAADLILLADPDHGVAAEMLGEKAVGGAEPVSAAALVERATGVLAARSSR